MPDEPRRSFWQTLPGMITALAATVTALTGFVVAVQQFLHTVHDGTPGVAATTTLPATPALSFQPQPAAGVGASSPAEPVRGAEPSNAPAAGTAPVHVPEATPPGSEPTSDSANAALKGQKRRVGRFSYEILAASIERRSGRLLLQLGVRKTAEDTWPGNLTEVNFRLIADGVRRAPVEAPNAVVPGRASADGDVVFVLPRGAKTVELELNEGPDETDTIPVPLEIPGVAPRPAPTPPSTLAAAIITAATGQRRRVGYFTYEVLSAAAEHRGADTLALTFEVRKTDEDTWPNNFMGSDFRLLIDGVPRAPVEGPNLVVPGRASVDGTVVFLLPTAARQVALEVNDGRDADTILLAGD